VIAVSEPNGIAVAVLSVTVGAVAGDGDELAPENVRVCAFV
jgi:hypothetical protein